VSEIREDVLRVEGVQKHFGPVTALRNIDLHLGKGEVLGLLGDNGAGKSTLIKIISGFQKPDAGRLVIKGEEVELRSVPHARSLGIDCVYQDLALVNQLNVVQNMFLQREQVHKPIPFLAGRKMRKETRVALDEIGVNLPRLNVPVARLSGGQRQAIAIARAVHWANKVVFLDEPTAALGVRQTRNVLDTIRRVSEHGIAVVFISHSMPHVMEVSDRVQVLRLGRRVASYRTADTSMEQLVAAMTGATKDAA
jgi:simple sugar transport system ATP-binding protein